MTSSASVRTGILCGRPVPVRSFNTTPTICALFEHTTSVHPSNPKLLLNTA